MVFNFGALPEVQCQAVAGEGTVNGKAWAGLSGRRCDAEQGLRPLLLLI
jgi:hypothetical protein